MSARFATNYLVMLLGTALVILLFALGRPVADWVAVGAGAAAIVMALYSFAMPAQGVAQRLADPAIAAVGTWAIVAARVMNDPSIWLVLFLGLSSALGAMQPILEHDVHLSSQGLQLTLGMANAAYALGTVLAVQLAVHYPQRRLLVIYAAFFTLGSVLAATAFTPGLFIAGHVIQGLFTSMMLIAAAPALVLGWPSSRLPTTAMVMNLGIFGAVAAGPFFGGLQAQAHGWRPMFWIVCGIGATTLLLSLLTFEDTPPQAPEAPRDWWAIVLAGLGCACAFFGASELQTHPMVSLLTLPPLVG